MVTRPIPEPRISERHRRLYQRLVEQQGIDHFFRQRLLANRWQFVV